MWAARTAALRRSGCSSGGGGVRGAARWLSAGAAAPEVNVAVVGGSGYTGAELIRMLAGHPYAKVRRCSFCSLRCSPTGGDIHQLLA